MSRAWRQDKALLALLVLFAALAPLATHRIYASDEIQYFAYTRSLFFDGDLDFSNEYLHFYEADPVKFKAIYDDLYNKREPLTNLPLNVAPIGTGLFWMPAYALAHGAATAAGSLGVRAQADGYSQPYISAICLTSYLLGCAGLLLCYSLAKRYFGRRVSAVAVAVLWLSTPLIFYTVVAPPWSHATSLFTVTLFLWYWDGTRRVEGRTWREWALLGVAAGLMMLVREQDALFLVVPAVEAGVSVVRGRGSVRRGQEAGDLHVKQNRQDSGLLAVGRWAAGMALMGLVAAVVFIPQLLAYRVITGAFGPSKVVSGKFTWAAPNFLNVLFSPEHGLITWTPVVLVALIGLPFLWRRDRVLALATGLAFLLQLYVAGSFLTWQSAGSFGQRRFINSTAIWALALCALLTWLMANGLPRWLIGGFLALFIFWNGGLLMQYALWCSEQRQGLDWARVIQGQLEMPGRAASLMWDYVMDRQKFYRRTRQC